MYLKIIILCLLPLLSCFPVGDNVPEEHSSPKILKEKKITLFSKIAQKIKHYTYIPFLQDQLLHLETSYPSLFKEKVSEQDALALLTYDTQLFKIALSHIVLKEFYPTIINLPMYGRDERTVVSIDSILAHYIPESISENCTFLKKHVSFWKTLYQGILPLEEMTQDPAYEWKVFLSITQNGNIELFIDSIPSQEKYGKPDFLTLSGKIHFLANIAEILENQCKKP